MTAIFNFPIPMGLDEKPEIRMKRLDLGGGYVQRATEGINPLRADVELPYVGISDALAESINAFLEEHGVSGFYWTRPGSAGPKKYICPAWGRKYVGHNNNNLTLPFEQVTA